MKSSRREFVGLSVAGLSALSLSRTAAAQAACVSGVLPAFVPNSLTVDCASRRNFQSFRQYSDFMGLAGVVSMTTVSGSLATYPAGNLFLFPWLKPAAQAQRRSWPAVLPASASRTVNASPIPNASLPIDEYFCRVVLQVPPAAFIGFLLDTPVAAAEAQFAWFTNLTKLADGKGAGIDWTSANLNDAWFGGSRWIPASDACHGSAWRQVIIAAVNQASSGAC